MKEFLNQKQYIQLRYQHHLDRYSRTCDRIKTELFANKSWTFNNISDALLFSEETVSNHVHEHINHNRLRIQTRWSQNKLDSEQKEVLIAYFINNIFVKVNDICAYVSEKYKIDYTVLWIRSCLHGHVFSYKKPSLKLVKIDPLKWEVFIKAHEQLMIILPKNETILFCDELCSTMSNKTTYKLIKNVTNKFFVITVSRALISLFGTINLEDIKLTLHTYEIINSNSMIIFFDKIKLSYPYVSNIHLILDLESYNISKTTKKKDRQHNIILHYLSFYSQNLRSIELLWKMVNEYVRNNRFLTILKNFEKISWIFSNIYGQKWFCP